MCFPADKQQKLISFTQKDVDRVCSQLRKIVVNLSITVGSFTIQKLIGQGGCSYVSHLICSTFLRRAIIVTEQNNLTYQ